MRCQLETARTLKFFDALMEILSKLPFSGVELGSSTKITAMQAEKITGYAFLSNLAWLGCLTGPSTKTSACT